MRIVVAISEDNQWLVTEGEANCWDVWMREGDARYSYHDYVGNTGQNAEDALETFLAAHEFLESQRGD
jgi:hypothetical protein